MVCQYCGARNHSDDHRCGRCGRRVNDEPVRRPAMPPVQQAATAPALSPAALTDAPPRPGPQLVTELPPPAAAATGATAQPSLFGPMEVARTQPRKPEPVPQASARRRADRSLQGTLDLFAPDGQRALPTAVQAAVYCNAPVAEARERIVAATIDFAIPCCGFALFVTAAHFTGAPVTLDSHSGPFLGAAALLIVAFYRIVCCIGNVDTPGLQWSGLSLLNFDGFRPTRKARFYRLAGGIVSSLSAGIGLLWSLLDEERLTWHDYMSGTFPTRRRLS
jgi:uncharacterized RDD family membrane protein YckC